MKPTPENQQPIPLAKAGNTAGRKANTVRAQKVAADYLRHGNKTKACRDNGVKTAHAVCTRYFNQQATRAAMAASEAEHLAALKRAGADADSWARGLKIGVDAGVPASLRLYAEVKKLVGSGNASRVIVMVVQQIVPVVAKYIPAERRGEFMAELRAIDEA